MPGSMSFEDRFEARRKPSKPGDESEQAMRILVLGDFSGAGARGDAPSTGLAARRPVRVDVDTFDQVFSRLAPRLSLAPARPGEPAIGIELESLEDFHPDRLVERLELFRALRETRRRLADPATFAEAAGALKRDAEEAPPPAGAASESETETLSRLLGKAPVQPREGTGAAALAGRGVDLQGFIRSIVQPHVKPGADPRQESFVASADAAIGEQMRSVLHHPAFQALEGSWRSLHQLVAGELSEDVQFWVLNVSRGELVADLAAAGGDSSSALGRLVVESGAEGQPWALLIADLAFGTDEADLRLLAGLGAIAERAGATLLAAAAPGVLGCSSMAEASEPGGWKPLEATAEARWRSMRTSPVARRIGLALPGVMMRLPYGRHTDPTERFAFEELPDGPEPGGFLWGNPAFACAILLARSFEARGWSMEPGDHLQLDGRPAHVYTENGQSRLTPCTEAAMSERAGEAALARGVIPLLGFPSKNALRVLRFQSLADPPAPLAGRWQ